jgi:hypothetical protein
MNIPMLRIFSPAAAFFDHSSRKSLKIVGKILKDYLEMMRVFFCLLLVTIHLKQIVMVTLLPLKGYSNVFSNVLSTLTFLVGKRSNSVLE